MKPFPLLWALLLPSCALAQATSVGLTPALASPQPVATEVVFTAAAAGSGTFEYRFAVAEPGSASKVRKDYSTSAAFEWAPLAEGSHTVTVFARAREAAGTVVTDSESFTFAARATGAAPVVSATGHPLVALLSVPGSACATGSSVRGEHRVSGSAGAFSRTPERACTTGVSTNVHLAGLRASTGYEARYVVTTSGVETPSATISFSSGAVSGVPFPSFSVTTPADALTSTRDGVLLLSAFPSGSKPLPAAVDLAGSPIWYEPSYASAIEILTTGTERGSVLLLVGDASDVQGQILREVDLAGNLVRETSIRRVREQLGLSLDCASGTSCLGAFDHEAIRFSNGQTLVQCSYEKLILGAQGGTGLVDVLGAMLVALDDEWQVAWSWDSFAHLDVSRAATMGEVCLQGPGGTGIPGCPPIFLRASANDWLHGNAISETPDGNLVYSMRDQDRILKIRYVGGAGDGAILWTLGSGGDFALGGSDPTAWFTHQHGALFVDERTLLVFDNGNLRCQGQSGCPSRAQAWDVDTATWTATPLVATNVGYSLALGSTQRLSNGNLHYTSGAQELGTFTESIELLDDGAVSFVLRTGAPVYRSYRAPSLHSFPLTGSPACAGCLHAVTPCRVADTRNATGTFGGPALAASAARDFPIAGSCGIPAGATSVAANVTVTAPAADGLLSLYPAGTAPPTSTTISFRAGVTRANNALLSLGGSPGAVSVLNGSAGAVHFILDVTGFFR